MKTYDRAGAGGSVILNFSEINDKYWLMSFGGLQIKKWSVNKACAKYAKLVLETTFKHYASLFSDRDAQSLKSRTDFIRDKLPALHQFSGCIRALECRKSNKLTSLVIGIRF